MRERTLGLRDDGSRRSIAEQPQTMEPGEVLVSWDDPAGREWRLAVYSPVASQVEYRVDDGWGWRLPLTDIANREIVRLVGLAAQRRESAARTAEAGDLCKP